MFSRQSVSMVQGAFIEQNTLFLYRDRRTENYNLSLPEMMELGNYLVTSLYWASKHTVSMRTNG